LFRFDDHVLLRFSLFVSNSKQSSGLCLPQHLQFKHSALFSNIACCTLNLTDGPGHVVLVAGFALVVPAVLGLLFLLFVLPPFFCDCFANRTMVSLP